jgi:hypothetical protein
MHEKKKGKRIPSRFSSRALSLDSVRHALYNENVLKYGKSCQVNLIISGRTF